ncbi:MAG: preprotein translocase subunit SecG [Candidatus Omnitrophica bacterium]|nr:preprotein translocase subunit SecG [Candidatus Omnitrophota bacterium]
MMTFILVIHAIACILLVLTVLMQAGRGGGLTETFSGAENVFGAQTSDFLVRATSILAGVFFTTSLILAFFSAHHDRSLMANQKIVVPAQTSAAKNAAAQTLDEAANAVGSVNAQVQPVVDEATKAVEAAPAAAPQQ